MREMRPQHPGEGDVAPAPPDGPTLHQSSADGLSLRIRRSGAYAIVSLQGYLDMRSTAVLEEKLLSIEAEGPEAVVLDLRGLRFLDSTGVALTLQANARAAEAGRRFVIVPGPSAVQRPFELAGLESVLEFREDGDRIEEDLAAAE